MQNKFDVIILSLAANDKLFETTKRSVDSYFETADELINKVIVMETNKHFDKSYNNSKVRKISITINFITWHLNSVHPNL
jgi:hypothetical protein